MDEVIFFVQKGTLFEGVWTSIILVLQKGLKHTFEVLNNQMYLLYVPIITSFNLTHGNIIAYGQWTDQRLLYFFNE